MTNQNTNNADLPEGQVAVISPRRIEKAIAKAHAMFIESHPILTGDRRAEALVFLRLVALSEESRLSRPTHLTVSECHELEALFITAMANL